MSENVLNPTGNKILLEIPKKEEKIIGGIIIPCNARVSKIADRFVVLAKGPDVSEEIQVGDTIVLSAQYCGIFTKFDGKEYVMCKEPEIACILYEDEEETTSAFIEEEANV